LGDWQGERRGRKVRAVVALVDRLARCLVLGTLLDDLTARFGGYELLAHWKQGEFHHDLVIRLPEVAWLPGRVLVVATNCNGGIKEVLGLTDVPDRRALWHHRCPSAPEFKGELGPIVARATTEHWFDPCDLLAPNARSELRPEYRRRQEGGGWEYAVLPRDGGRRTAPQGVASSRKRSA
jgi:hypothetical protein